MIAIPAIPYLLWAINKRPESAATGTTLLGLWLVMGALTGLCFWLLSGRMARPESPSR